MKSFFVVLFLHVYLLVMLSIFKHCMIFWLAIERHTLTVLEELRDQNRTIISLLHQLLSRSLVNGQDADGELPSGLVIPVQNVEELVQTPVLRVATRSSVHRQPILSAGRR